jgi:hypothetical protein
LADERLPVIRPAGGAEEVQVSGFSVLQRTTGSTALSFGRQALHTARSSLGEREGQRTRAFRNCVRRALPATAGRFLLHAPGEGAPGVEDAMMLATTAHRVDRPRRGSRLLRGARAMQVKCERVYEAFLQQDRGRPRERRRVGPLVRLRAGRLGAGAWRAAGRRHRLTAPWPPRRSPQRG